MIPKMRSGRANMRCQSKYPVSTPMKAKMSAVPASAKATG